MAMVMDQLLGRRCSLRDIVASMDAQSHKRYHMSVGRVSRSSLVRLNEKRRRSPRGLVFDRHLCCVKAAGCSAKGWRVFMP